MTVTVAWNDEQIDMLTRMWADGASAAEIARALRCGATRSAVIGKVRRLKLPKRSNLAIRNASRDGLRATLNAGPSVRSQPRRGRTGGAGQSSAAAILHRVAARKAGRDQTEEGVPVVRPLNFADRRMGHECSWIDGDPLHAGAHFCGQPTVNDSEWCEAHRARVYLKRGA